MTTERKHEIAHYLHIRLRGAQNTALHSSHRSYDYRTAIGERRGYLSAIALLREIDPEFDAIWREKYDEVQI